MPKNSFTVAQREQIVEAIKQAELNTSGEIRVHMEASCGDDPYVRAKEVFEQLGMAATVLKNGILIYIAFTDRKFAILGDKGIHEKVGDHFWVKEKELMLDHFKRGEFTEGICLAIQQAGEKLKIHFPYLSDDKDELSNDISFGGGEDA